jgi:hypothetical protein
MPLRYVILRHDGVPEPHFDLMFETAEGSALATWRSPLWPPVSEQRVEKLPDHRREYLDYEGPVSNDRGRVARVECGTYETFPQDEPLAIAFRLRGHVEHERVVLLRGNGGVWSAILLTGPE